MLAVDAVEPADCRCDGSRRSSDGGSESCNGLAIVEAKPKRSTADIANERRTAKLDSLREQVENGSLIIRQMTAQERKRYPPRPKPPPRRKP
ncbi:MAG TPA: hypothetical protein VHX66_14415 [Solirubrobacteraceae bacterium]|nr:hypothetical protein [Solirubrobacteraceae bacterium]